MKHWWNGNRKVHPNTTLSITYPTHTVLGSNLLHLCGVKWVTAWAMACCWQVTDETSNQLLIFIIISKRVQQLENNFEQMFKIWACFKWFCCHFDVLLYQYSKWESNYYEVQFKIFQVQRIGTLSHFYTKCHSTNQSPTEKILKFEQTGKRFKYYHMAENVNYWDGGLIDRRCIYHKHMVR